MRVRQPKDLEGVDTERGTHPVVSALAPDLARIGEAISAEGQAAREHADRMASLSVHAMRLDVSASLPHAERAIEQASQASASALADLAAQLGGQAQASSEQVAQAISQAAQTIAAANLQMAQALAAAIARKTAFTMTVTRDERDLIQTVSVVPA